MTAGIGTRTLGSSGLVVSAEGLGCAGFSSGYAASDDDESALTIRRALELGITFFDTASLYGDGHNEELLGKVFAGRTDVVIATKFGFQRNADGSLRVDGRPDRIRANCEASLRRLRVEAIDIYYPHRVDETVPIEETVGAMAELVTDGLIRHIGLCEASSRTLERANAVHPITALESEWSLWTRDIEDDVRVTTTALGIGVVPYCPLGRGFLTGTITSTQELDSTDYRRSSPRFAEENLARNLRIVDDIRALAAEKGCSPAQLSLAWVLAQGPDVVPIPGTRRQTYLEENVNAAFVELTESDLARLDQIAPKGVAVGDRYAGGQRYADTPA